MVGETPPYPTPWRNKVVKKNTNITSEMVINLAKNSYAAFDITPTNKELWLFIKLQYLVDILTEENEVPSDSTIMEIKRTLGIVDSEIPVLL